MLGEAIHSMAEKQRVAVIGLGACGLTALKNLREAGFDAVGLEGNSYVAGLWQHSEDPEKTTVLKTTLANLSKRLACYTDFPYPDETPDYATAAQTAEYLNQYAKHFDLLSHSRLNTRVQHIARDGNHWSVKLLEKGNDVPSIERFDKVVLSVGTQVQRPSMPKIKGLETFTGRALHSNSYKQSSAFKDKRVVVVGLGNTGPDTAVDLVGVASEVWLSHRTGNAIFTRWNKQGKPFDHMLSMRLTKLGGWFNQHFPNFSQKVSVVGMQKVQKAAFDIKPEWNLSPIPLPTRKVPTMNEHLIPALHAEKIRLKPALTEIHGDALFFSDGTTLSRVDAIIFCTGFKSDYSILSGEADPTLHSRKDWSSLPGANGRPLPRLYQGIFSLAYPDSLAFLGTSPLTPQACLNYDISSQAVAQVWLGNSGLPSRQQMSAHVDAQHEAVCEIARSGPLANTNLRNNWEWYKWCDGAAGIGLVKRMGYGVEGWKFWWQDRKLSKMLMDGMLSPHLFRLFDEGKREGWSGAREALEHANREAGKI